MKSDRYDFSVNLDFVCGRTDHAKAIREIKKIGYNGAEIVFLHEHEMDELKKATGESGVDIKLIATEFIHWIDGNDEDRFLKSVISRIAVARELTCKKIVLFGDDKNDRMSHTQQLYHIYDIVKRLLPYFERNGVTLLIEPLNNMVDHKNCSLYDFFETVEILRDINSPHLKMLYDIYHMQVMHGNVTDTVCNHLDLISHIHCAGCPGRTEIYHGELEYNHILKSIYDAGYDGSIGLEYTPTDDWRHTLKETIHRMKC